MKLKNDEQYIELLPVWSQIRAAIGGKLGVVKLLNSDQGYFSIIAPNYRTNNAVELSKRKFDFFSRGRFTNFTGTTHDTYLGMISEKPIEVELPDRLEGLKSNADGANSSLQDFANNITSEVLITARSGILVDPPTLTGGTIADANQALPLWVSYKAEDITSYVVDKNKLVQVVLNETYYEYEDGVYVLKSQVRILNLRDGVYTSTIYRDNKQYEVVTPMVNGSTMDYIPFIFIGSENNHPCYDRPVMFDLAHQNLGHFELDCNNRDNLHYHGQGMTNVYTSMDNESFSELNPSGMDVGAKGKNMFDQGDRVEILQIEATGAIASEMLRDEQRMIMLGAQVVQDKSSSKTLGGEVMEKNAATSQLKRIAINVSQGLTQCAIWSAEIMGVPDDNILVKVNNRFVTESMTFQDVLAMFQMVQGGAASLEELHEVKRKAGYTDKTNEELDDTLENEADGESEVVAELRMQLDNLTSQLNSQSENQPDE